MTLQCSLAGSASDTHIRPFTSLCTSDDVPLNRETELWSQRDALIQKQLVPKVRLFATKTPGCNTLHTTVAFESSADRQITGMRLMQASGSAYFDSACLSAVKSLENTDFLNFPTGSKCRLSRDYVVFSIPSEDFQPNPAPVLPVEQMDLVMTKTPEEIMQALTRRVRE